MDTVIGLSIISPTVDNVLEIKKQIKAIGMENTLFLQKISTIRQEVESQSSDIHHVTWQLITELITVLSTDDPHQSHYEIAREILKAHNSNLLNYQNIVDRLARELCDHIRLLRTRLKTPEAFKQITQVMKTSVDEAAVESGIPVYPSFDVIETTHEGVEDLFKSNGTFLWHNTFIEFIKTIGHDGKKAAKKMVEREYHTCIKSNKSFWFNLEEENKHIYLSNALKVLTSVLFNDKVSRLVPWNTKYVAALTTNILKPINNMLAPSNTVSKEDNALQLFNQDKLVGNIDIPTISKNIFNSVLNGIHKLNTVIGHRLIRFFPQKSFDAMIKGDNDYRVLKFDRGATEIAEQIGVSGGKGVINTKEIVHAMAFFHFSGPDLSGNLIQLTKYESPTTHRNEAYIITVGVPLLPYRTFEDGGLLIPILKDPPLVNPNQYHANQYLLQMKIMEEFTKQSMYLTTQGVIQINNNRWNELILECGLTPEVFRKVHDRWTQDGTDGTQFLEQVESGFYTLGKDHAKVSEFLKDQGKMRLAQSERGKKSAQKQSTKRTTNMA